MDHALFLALVALPLPIGLLYLTEVIKNHGPLEDCLRKLPNWTEANFPSNIQSIESHDEWGAIARGYFVELSISKQSSDSVVYELIAFVVVPSTVIVVLADKLKVDLISGVSWLLIGQLACITSAIIWLFRAKRCKQLRDSLEYLALHAT